MSRVDNAMEGGNSALMAVTPDVKFEWVKRTPCKSPEDVSKKARVKGSLGPGVDVRILQNHLRETTYEREEAPPHQPLEHHRLRLGSNSKPGLHALPWGERRCLFGQLR